MVEEDEISSSTLDVFRYAPRSVLVIVFAVFLVVITLSNLSVLVVLISCKKMRTKTNIYILSVCVASLLVGVFTCASSLHELTASEEIGASDERVCVAFVYLEILSITACVFSLVATSIDRYRTIVQYNKPRISMRQTYFILIGVWSFAIIYGGRSVLQSVTDYNEVNDAKSSSTENSTEKHEEDERNICSNFLEDESGDVIFRVVDLVVLFILPFFVMVVFYSLVIRKLFSSGLPATSRTQDKRKSIRLLATIVVTFFVCWFPFYLFEVIHDVMEVNGIEMEAEAFAGARVWSLLLAMSNSWLCPLVYCYLNNNFRAELKRLILNAKRYGIRVCTRSDNVVNPEDNYTNTSHVSSY